MDALTSLYSELSGPLKRYAMSLVKEIHMAEDIVSETFLRATKHCIAYNELPARAWFFKVARNISLDTFRKNAKIDFGEVPETIDNCRETNPEDAAVYFEQVQILAAILSKMPEPYKSVLILKEYDNLTYAEIANILDLSIDNVKVLLFRGRQKLRDLYRRDYKK